MADTGLAETGLADTGLTDTGLAETAVADAALAGPVLPVRPLLAVRRQVPLHPRLCAGAAAASAAAHGWMAWLHRGSWWESGLMVLMAAACLSCVVQLWRSGCAGAARSFMGMALAMAGFHLLLLVQPLGGGTHAPHLHHTAVAATVQAASSGAGGGAGSAGPMLTVILLELAGAMAAATWIRRSAGQL
jgi:hypothetical protein